MPPNVEHMEVLRIVVREGLSYDLAEMLLSDLKESIARVRSGGGLHPPDRRVFKHG